MPTWFTAERSAWTSAWVRKARAPLLPPPGLSAAHLGAAMLPPEPRRASNPVGPPLPRSRRPPGAAAQPQGAWLPLHVFAGKRRQGSGRPGALHDAQLGLRCCAGAGGAPAPVETPAPDHAHASRVLRGRKSIKPARLPPPRPRQLAVMRYWNGNRVNVPRTTVMYLSGQRGVQDVVRAGRQGRRTGQRAAGVPAPLHCCRRRWRLPGRAPSRMSHPCCRAWHGRACCATGTR